MIEIEPHKMYLFTIQGITRYLYIQNDLRPQMTMKIKNTLCVSKMFCVNSINKLPSAFALKAVAEVIQSSIYFGPEGCHLIVVKWVASASPNGFTFKLY